MGTLILQFLVRSCAARRRAIAGVVTVLFLVPLVGLALIAVFTGRISLAQPTRPAQPTTIIPQNLMVRGYIAVAVGRSSEAEKSGVYSRLIAGKDIHLPGVEVFLSDPQGGKASEPATTDLSGRFTLYASERGRYRICWKSSIYGDGCDANFVSAGAAPQFVSTVHIRIQKQSDRVAVMGHVTTADGALPRTFDPLMNINAFATVNLDDERGNRIAAVYVNNFGDYLLPYVPVKQKIKLTAGIESANFTQEIWPEAKIEAAALHQVNLKFENHRPRLDPLVALDSVSNRRVQNASPGSTVNVVARASDKDGDPVEFAWFVDPADGELLPTTGPAVQWKLPATPGRFTVTVVAYDGKGGYDKAVLSVLADGRGVPFTGIVVTPRGAPVADASIEIVGNPAIKTDARGRFQTNVKVADRYVFNARKDGYALNSRVYDSAVTGGRWILRPAQVLTIDPTKNVRIAHQRGDGDCLGPDSVRAGLGAAGESLTIPQWQDGKGSVIDPPSWWDGPRSATQIGKKKAGNSRTYGRKRQPVTQTYGRKYQPVTRNYGRKYQPAIQTYGRKRQPVIQAYPGKRPPVILPRDLKLPKCGPGVTVQIPANSILDPNGQPATAPLKVTIATVDLLSPQQMPGDDSVVPSAGGGAYLKSFGAGSVDLPAGFKLRPGASAKITIPVDRARLMGGSLPPTVPLLSYDEDRGMWVEENTLTLSVVNGVQTYIGSVKHFTTYNADTFFNNAACLRVFSPSLPGQYNLEAMSPYPDGTPHYKNYPIDNVTSTEHVIYNITPNANMTLAPMTQGPNPQLLGFYVVNSGPPETPPHSPNAPPGPPYTTCNNFVVLTVGNAPDSPFGGEFLNGLGFIDAVNLGFDDLTAAGPTGNALRDAIVAASTNYYGSVDPTNLRTTFADFKSHNGFPTGEIVAQYANSGDLGFGRDMHCLKNANNDVACYVTNYGTGYTNVASGGGTPDQDDADAAGLRNTVGASAEVATVAMEYAPIENDSAGDKVVKFFVYKKALANYGRSISANLDGRGERPVPQLCMICHGGQILQQPGGVPIFAAAADVKLGSRFLPFDHRFFTFPGNPALSKANQEASIKSLNKNIVDLVPAGAPTTDPIRELVTALYDDGTTAGAPAQIHDSPVTGWKPGQPAPNNLPGQTDFYNNVVANTCRTCHTAQPFPQLQFNTADKFVNLAGVNLPPAGLNNKLMLGTAQLRVCGDYVMAHAFRTHQIFWNEYWEVLSWGPPPTPLATQFQTFGDGLGGSTWKAGLCTSFISSLVSTPSNFYEQSIQPIWNGKCVACHITSGIGPFKLTENDSYSALLNGTRVVPGNDNNNAGTLLQRITGVGPGAKMPLNCIPPPTPPGPGQLPCLEQSDIDKIKAWIRSGAN